MKSVFALGAVAATLLTAAAPSAHAIGTLNFIVNGVPVVAAACADGAACDQLNSLGVGVPDGFLDFSMNLGSGFTVSVTGLTKPLLTGNPIVMDLNSVSVQSGTGNNQLVILFSDIGFTQTGAMSGEFGGTIQGTAGSTISAEAFYGTGLFDQTNSLGIIGPFAAGVDSPFSGSTGSTLISQQPSYSLTQRLTFNTTGFATYSGDFGLNIPEPGTLALVGAALLGLGTLRRRVK